MSFAFEAQIGRAALQRFVRTLHAAGGMPHRGTHFQDGTLYDYVIGCPEIDLVESSVAPKLEMRTRICAQGRPIGSAGTLGHTAVVDAPLQCVFRLPNGDPAPVAGQGRLRVDVTLGQLPENAVTASDAGFRAAVRKLLPSVIGRYSPRVAPLPPLALGEQRVVSIATRVLAGGTGGAVLALGFNTQRGGDGASALGLPFLERDWSVRIPADRFVATLDQRLKAEMPTPFRISRRCTVTAPWSRSECWNWETVRLREATVGILGERISVTGTIDVRNSGALIPDVTVNFLAQLELALTSGGAVTASVRSVTVAFGEWYADVVNFFSGNAFRPRLERAIRDAMETQIGRTNTLFFGLEVIQTLVAFGSSVALPIELEPRTIRLSPLGLVLSGDLVTPEARRQPEVSFQATKVGPWKFLLNARGSWAPGGHIVKYEWSDPQRRSDPVVSQGVNARYIHEHTVDFRILDRLGAFVHGTTPVARMCLKVTDDQGATASTCTELVLDEITLSVDPTAYEYVPRGRVGVVRPTSFSARRPWGEGALPLDETAATDWLGVSAHLHEQLIVLSDWRGRFALTLSGDAMEAPDRCVVRLVAASGWTEERRLDRYGRLRVSIPLPEAQGGARAVSIARDVVYVHASVDGRTGGRLVLWLTTMEDRTRLYATLKESARALTAAPEPAGMNRGVLRQKALRRLQAGAAPAELRRGLGGVEALRELDEEFERVGDLLRSLAKRVP